MDQDKASVPRPSATLHHDVRSFDAQRDGMAFVSGWEVYACVTYSSGRTSSPVFVALCRDEDAARAIAELLNGRYAPAEVHAAK